MKKPKQEKEVIRVLKLEETDWKWLNGWMEQLLKTLDVGDLNPDVLRMARISRLLHESPREDDEL